jgi:hypothetical protein
VVVKRKVTFIVSAGNWTPVVQPEQKSSIFFYIFMVTRKFSLQDAENG